MLAMPDFTLKQTWQTLNIGVIDGIDEFDVIDEFDG